MTETGYSKGLAELVELNWLLPVAILPLKQGEQVFGGFSMLLLIDNPLRGSQFGTMAARVKLNLSRAGGNDLLIDQPQAGSMAANTGWCSRRANAAFGLLVHKLFDDAVFQGMVADNH